MDFEEFFEEFLKPSHLRDELLMLLGFLSFEDFPSEKYCLLPPKLYLVVFYQVSLVNRTRITCSDFRRILEVLLGSACCTISHVHTPWGNCNKFYSMIVSIKDSVS